MEPGAAGTVQAEILSIGSELLLGQILDTNTQYLSCELAAIGIGCYWHSTVGDNKERIKASLQTAFNRADLLITTGGLGPTADDLTIECLAEFFQVGLSFDEAVMANIAAMFDRRGIAMPDSNRKQALRPQGAQILPNPYGTAPGIIWRIERDLLVRAGLREPQRCCYVLTFPGVPLEMKGMWKETARDFLAGAFGCGVILSCDLKHYGIGESALAEMHAGLLDLANPTVAPLAGTGECRLRVTSRAATEQEARDIAYPVIKAIKDKSGLFFYGTDDDTLESVVGALLLRRGLTIALAESCTGGLISKRLTDVPGSSNYIKLNVVAYANEAKRDLLGISQEIIDQSGAVSAQSARAMASGIRYLAGTTFGLAVTGIAGPAGGSREKPVGTVYLALDFEHGRVDRELHFSSELSRAEIRHRTAGEALNIVRLHLLADRQTTSMASP